MVTQDIFPLNPGCRGTFELEDGISTIGLTGRNFDLSDLLMAGSIEILAIGQTKIVKFPDHDG